MQRLRASGVDSVCTPTPEEFLNSVGNWQSPLNDDADVTATCPNGQFILSKIVTHCRVAPEILLDPSTTAAV